MSKHEIEVEGLPDGYEINEVELKTKHAWKENEIFAIDAVIHVKQKQPRRIVLEETDEYHEPESPEDMHTTIFQIHDCATAKVISNKKWREVKETEETKLCLSVEECEEMVYNDYSIPVDLSVKIHNFLSTINKTS